VFSAALDFEQADGEPSTRQPPQASVARAPQCHLTIGGEGMIAFASIDWVKVGINIGVLLAALIAGWILTVIAVSVLKRVADHTGNVLDNSIAKHSEGPLKFIVPLLAFDIVMPSIALPSAVKNPVLHVIGLLLIFGVAWLTVRLALVVEDVLLEKFRVDVKDNLRARQIRTQFLVFRRVLTFAVTVIAFGVALTTFDWARTIGTSLLASAGIVGLAGSLAARPTIENLVAGLQIALTEPIRIEDVVIAENEWGWIEEINTTYVVVRIWDLRRLILPISYFVSKPFQNWTRQSADLLAYIHLNLDYRTPIEPLRQEFRRILETTPRWDKKVCVLQVTDATEHTLQVRALASAADSSTAWDLRCEVREKLLDFVQRSYPQILPRERAEFHGEISARVLAADGYQGAKTGNDSPAEERG
jgi:small-conductance mechanosensitive channel